MNFKVWCLGWITCFTSLPAWGFVHIHQLKPHLDVSPAQPLISFFWNGAAPKLDAKDGVFDGAFSEASDRDLMELLLKEAVRIWTDVPTAYIEMEIVEKADVELDPDDETFSIVVEKQKSVAVAAASLPSFLSQDPDPSDVEKNPHLIHDCDISVSDSTVEAKSLLHTLVHELGHCLGLGHPHSTYQSIMSYATFDQSAHLYLDDEAGVTFLYPEPSESQEVKSITCGRVGGGDAAGGGAANLARLLMGLSLCFPFALSLSRLWRRAHSPRP